MIQILLACLCLISEGAGQTLTDDFGTSKVLTNFATYSIAGTNTAASAQQGEPPHAGSPAERSLWTQIRVPFEAFCRFTVSFAPTPGVRMAVYSGNSLDSLIPEGSFISEGTNRTWSTVLSPNVSHHAAFDSLGTNVGPVRLTIETCQAYLREPRDGAVIKAPAAITLDAVWTDTSRALRQVDFYAGEFTPIKVGSRTNSPWSLAITNLGGTLKLYVTAIPVTGAAVTSLTTSVRIAPPNDRFDDAILIPGHTTDAVFTGSTKGSTAEAGEPMIRTNVAPSRSIWWRWTPAYGCRTSMRIANTNSALVVYTGSSITNLVQVTNSAVARTATFDAQAGVTYSICVDSLISIVTNISWTLSQPTLYIHPADNESVVPAGSRTTFNVVNLSPEHPLERLEWLLDGTPIVTNTSAPFDWVFTATTQGTHTVAAKGLDALGGLRFSGTNGLTVRPANDAFLGATPLPGDVTRFQVEANSRAGTMEPGEPAHAGGPNQGSLWYVWTPAAPGIAHLATPPELGGAVRLAAYTGQVVSNLLWLADNRLPTGGLTNHLVFSVQAGITYRIAVDGATAMPPFLLEFERHTLAFLRPALRSDLNFGQTNRFELACLDPSFEPVGGECLVDGIVVAAFSGAGTVWDWPGDLGGVHTFSARATNAAGEVRVTAPFFAYVGPANDDFDRAEPILAADGPWVLTGDTAFATWERGEIETNSWPGNGSVWFRWVPPYSRQYTMRFTGPEGTEISGFMGDTLPLMRPSFRGGTVDSWTTTYLPGAVPHYFRVSRQSQSGGAGPFRLELFASPSNDDFTNAIAIPPEGGTFEALNRSASLEASEPNVGCLGTLWWKWTAPAYGDIILEAEPSDCSVLSALFTGRSVDRLSQVASAQVLMEINTTLGYKHPTPRAYRVKAGVTYHLALGTGIGLQGPTSGTIKGSLVFQPNPEIPVNDDFEDRTPITGTNVVVSGNNTYATRESWEWGQDGVRTLWWEYTAPIDGAAHFWLDSPVFPPTLMVHTILGEWPSPYVSIMDISLFGGSAGVYTLPVKAGSRYQVSAGQPSWSTTPGLIRLHIFTYPVPAPPANDAFLEAALINTTQFTAAVDVFGSTFETGEPAHTLGLPPMLSGSGSLWWRFVPPANGRAIIEVRPADVNSTVVVGLYKGTSLGALELITHEFGGPITAEVQGGEEYRISVAAPSLNPTPCTLSLRMQGLVPTHNAFASSIHLEGTNITVSDQITGCNREAGEPSHGLYPTETLSGISAWWSWAAPFTGKAVLTLPGAADRFRLAVYTGPTIDRLAPVSAAREPERTFFAAEKDAVYHIAVELLPGAAGLVGFQIDEFPFAVTSPNDAFADAIELRGRSAGSLASNLAATREPGEPAHRLGGPNKSLWWRWTQPNSGDAQVSNGEGALRDVTFAVYTGTSVDALTLVAKGDGYLRFPGTGGQTYHIASETRMDANGDIDLQVSCPWPDGSAELVQGNAVRNGSFEEMTDALPIKGWDAPTGFLGAVGMIGAEGAADGTNYLVLSGNIIRQDIPTLPGGLYRLRLAVCATDQDGPARIDLRFGTAQLRSIAFEADYTQRYWHWMEFDVEAASATTSLEVESTGVRVGVDAVSVALRNQPPRIVTPPESRMAFAGTGASFHAGVSGDAPLVYRWEHDGAIVPDAVRSTLYLPSIGVSQAGNYQLIVTNAYGSVTSAPVQLRVETPASPTIVLQPQGQAVAPGGFVAIAVSALGTPPLRYQWFKNGQPIDGATQRNLVFSSYRELDAGEYSVVVANLAEAVNSLPATLRTAPAPTGGGLVSFANWVPDPQFPIKAWVTDVDGVTRLAGDAFRAQLYAGPDADALRPAGQPQPFLAGFAAGVWTPATVALPATPPGASCVVQVRVWEASSGASYEEARAMGGRIGRSTSLRITTGGEGAADPMPTLLAGLRGFSLAAGQPQFRVGELSVTGRDANGTIRIRLVGQPGSRYLIEKRGAAGIWSPFQILEIPDGTAEFADSAAVPQDAAAFYRARMLD